MLDKIANIDNNPDEHMHVNNEIYRSLGHAWWDEESPLFASLRFLLHPARSDYFYGVIERQKAGGRAVRTLLDVGCGGGFLTEELARAGFDVAGIDPAPETIEAAKRHAAGERLSIDYRIAPGEQIPFGACAFDAVFCCDVLEHVADVGEVIGEIARVLAPDGLFLYDTVNRTRASKLAVIKVMQEWKSTAFAEPFTHAWDKFITPAELAAVMQAKGLCPQEAKGLSMKARPLSAWLNLRRYKQRRITCRELGRRMGFSESTDMRVSYMGYAVRMR